MINPTLAMIRKLGSSLLLAELSAGERRSLFSTATHSKRLMVERSVMIIARTRLVAFLCGTLALLWVLIEAALPALGLRNGLLPLHLVMALAFFAITFLSRYRPTRPGAYCAILVLCGVPAAAQIFVMVFLASAIPPWLPDALAGGYACMPLVLAALPAVFPLALSEGAAFLLFALISLILVVVPGLRGVDWAAVAGGLVILLLIGGIAMLASVSQLALLTVKVREAMHDYVVGCFSRRFGEEWFELQFSLSQRVNSRLVLIVVDFSQPDHEVNEVALREVAGVLNDAMRLGDVLVRWSSDRFVLIAPNADSDHAEIALRRWLASAAPAALPLDHLLACYGLAERISDQAEDWWQLVDIAEARCVAARETGGNLLIPH